MRTLFAAALFAAAPTTVVAADDPDEYRKLTEAWDDAFEAGNFKEALGVAAKIDKLRPELPTGPHFAGLTHLRIRDNAAAVKSFTEAIRRDPKLAAAHDRRGDAHLKLGRWKEAIADFDRYLELEPDAAPHHWRRGIALYYAGRFADGRDQFELHRKVNPEDVENSAWHYLCNARATSPAKAREVLIPVTKDARVPMKQVLELFAGKLQPQDVLAAAENASLKGEAQKAARFYAHLYVALYYESEKDAKKAREHLTTAVEKHKIGHYMWDVGNAHLELLKQEEGKGGKR